MRGLRALGIGVSECRVLHTRKFYTRYPILTRRYARMKKDFDVVLVPEFRHKDVPLAAWLSRLGGKRCVFDPLVSRYDTKIHDRADASARALREKCRRRRWGG